MPQSNRPSRPRNPRAHSPFSLYHPIKRSRGKPRMCRNWWVRFTAPGPDGRPMQYRIGLRTDDYGEAERRAWDLYSRMKDPARDQNPAPLLSAFLPQYHRHLIAAKAQSTARNQWYAVKAFFEDTFPDWTPARLSDVTPALIMGYLDNLKLDRNASPWTLLDIRKSLSALFSFAVRQRACPTNPVKEVPCPKVGAGPIDYLKLAEIPLLLDAVSEEDPILLGPIAAGIFAGLRRSEIVWLTWEDVDLKSRTIFVRPKVVGAERYQTKTKRSRVVPISKDLLPILLKLQMRGEWVFSSPCGMRWHPDNLSNRLRRGMRAHGWSHAFNTFRHTFGSQLAQKGLSLYKISQLMGNSEDVCRQHYAAVATEQMQEEIAIMPPRESTSPPKRAARDVSLN